MSSDNMASKPLEVFEVCPLLIPQDSSGRYYEGYITACRKSFRFSIRIPEGSGLKDARIDCSWKLKHLLRDYQGILKQRLEQSTDLPSFLIELKSILERLLQSENEEHIISHPKYYTQLIEEVEAISWNKLVYVDSSFTVLKLLARDGRQRDHVLTIHLSSQALKSYEEFWDMMDEIDKNTWVLEPDHPQRSSNTRRIALGNNSSIHIEINPLHPRLLPECRFLGADHGKTRVQQNTWPKHRKPKMWTPKISVLTNLENVLKLKFPSPCNTKKEDFSMECGICYAYRLNDSIPDKACDDSRCGQPFHQVCLIEWLKSLSSSRQSFNMIFGECPYCSKVITLIQSVVVKVEMYLSRMAIGQLLANQSATTCQQVFHRQATNNLRSVREWC
ncbi:hypothetical protein QZH41_008474 [Actinostola sp. cb2023]|nr:hypothetical protein QZH41_008474 [Actinostola sp. cb2023]